MCIVYRYRSLSVQIKTGKKLTTTRHNGAETMTGGGGIEYVSEGERAGAVVWGGPAKPHRHQRLPQRTRSKKTTKQKHRNKTNQSETQPDAREANGGSQWRTETRRDSFKNKTNFNPAAPSSAAPSPPPIRPTGPSIESPHSPPPLTLRPRPP